MVKEMKKEGFTFYIVKSAALPIKRRHRQKSAKDSALSITLAHWK